MGLGLNFHVEGQSCGISLEMSIQGKQVKIKTFCFTVFLKEVMTNFPTLEILTLIS